MRAFQKSCSSIAAVAVLSGMFFPVSAHAEPGITSNKIIIGQSAAFTGSPSEEVRQATAGAIVYFDRVNEQGGIFGRKIILESLDDGFEPKRTVENTKKLLGEKNAFALFLYRGTPTTEAILPLIRDAKVPLIAPVTGASLFHEPMSRYLFNVRPKYRDEVRLAVRQLSTMGMQRLAVLASDDSFGADALEGLKSAVKEYKLPEPTVAKYDRTTGVVDGAVTTILAAQPQAVLMFCTPKPCDAFIKQFRKQGGKVPLSTLSNLSSRPFFQGLGDDVRGLGITQAFPNPRNTTIPISKEFQDMLKVKADLSESYPALEGFVSAKVLVEGLRKAGPHPTREGLVAALESLKGFDLGGINLNFSPTSRDGSDFIELTVIGRNGTVVR
jgi:ABC-type branched-subunit amino acid transport system substrate-binding protein